MAIFGTNGNDVLTGDQLMFGLGGADSITRLFGTGFLDGGAGADTLSASYTYPAAFWLANLDWTMLGGSGDDSITASTNITNDGNARDLFSKVLIDGGSGDDSISVDHSVDLVDPNFTFTPDISSSVTVIDRSGDNIVSIVSDLDTEDGLLSTATNVILGSGADTVTINNSGYANNFAPGSNHYVNLGGGDDALDLRDVFGSGDSVVYGGRGNDTLTTNFFGEEGNSGGIYWDIFQDAGAGDDTVIVNLKGASLDFNVLTGFFDLGGGDDTLRITTEIWGSFTVDTGQGANVVQIDYTASEIGSNAADALVKVSGGGGKDTIAITGQFLDPSSVNTDIDTGFGNDVINITKTAENTVDAGDNNDVIYVDAYTDNFGIDRSSLVDGGNGNDTITARDVTGATSAARTHDITGGSGNDLISSQITGLGQHLITGDGGNDQINVFGGADAVIDGGTGSDTIAGGAGDDAITGGGGADNLAGGIGNDTMTGNAGADMFAFNVTANQGADVITDWNEVVDSLDVNLVDNNANGLVDEFDAIASYSTVGADLLVSFSGGGSITFTGAGPVTSIADIMDDPLMQLV